MVLAKVTEDHVARAKRLIGVGLDVEEVSQWLATYETDKAEIKRLRAELVEIEECFDEANKYIVDYMAEIDRLQVIVDKLPKTADGVPVVPGKDIVWHPDVRHIRGAPMPLDIDANGEAAWWRTPDERYSVEDCYSTQEAAKASGD